MTDEPLDRDSRRQVQLSRSLLMELITSVMEREQLGSLSDFADKYGIGRSTLYELVRGRSRSRGAWVMPSLTTMISLADALDRPLHELLYLIQPDAPGAAEAAAMARFRDCKYVPVEIAGWVGAGPRQDEASDEAPIVVEQGFARGRDLRAFRIRGDSMDAGRAPIHDGDVVVVDVGDKGSNTASVVARLTDGSYVCKALKDDLYGKLLQSRNVDHTNGTPSAIPIEDVAEIVGRVVRVLHDDP